MKTGTRALLIIVVIVLAVGLITFFNRMKGGGGGELVKEVKRSRSPVTVQISRVMDLAETINHTDTVQAAKDVTLTAEVAGKVVKIHKDLGDRCSKGAVLLQLDGEAYKIAVMQAEAVFKRAMAQLEQRRLDLARADKLVKRSTIAAKTSEQARTGVQTALAGAKQAGAALRLAKRNLRLTRVTCPFTGEVAGRLVTAGQMVGNATPLARLVDTSRLKLTVKVPASDMARIHAGQPVAFSDPAISGSNFSGKVSRLGVAADQFTHTFPVEMAVSSKGSGAPRPGQVLRASITVATHAGALAVPDTAIIYRGKQEKTPHLALARGDNAHLISITLGPRVAGQVVVTSGLEADEQVIIVGQHGLTEGAPIEVMNGNRAAKAAKAPPAKKSAKAK